MSTSPQKTLDTTVAKSWWVLGWIVLGVMLVICVPLSLCMPPWVDTTVDDVCASNLLSGGVHYRDTMDTNFPGIVWMHVLVRCVVGWSSEALRAADLAIMTGTFLLFLRLLKSAGVSSTGRLWTMVALLACYFSLSESCQCQRDTWMMLFALAAIVVRWVPLDRPPGSVSGRRLLFHSFCAGLGWGAAIWIKPFVILPAAACSLVLLGRVEPGSRPSPRTVLTDLVGLTAGALAVGAAGLFWLWGTGGWPYFWDIMLGWNRDYLHTVTIEFRAVRLLILGFWRLPWSLAVAVAFFFALGIVWTGFRSRAAGAWDRQQLARLLLAALSLSWLVQAVCIQHPHDYVLSAAIFPALALVATWRALAGPSIAARLLLAAFAAAVVALHPLLGFEHLRLWGRCCVDGSTPEIRDAITSGFPVMAPRPDWQDLARVEQYLRGRGVRDREMTCWDDSSLPLYLSLRVQPASRFVSFMWVRIVPGRRSEILSEFAATRQRFVVSDLVIAGVPLDKARLFNRESSLALPRSIARQLPAEFPWRQRLVFRSGRYVVFEIPAEKPAAAPSSGGP